MNTPNTPLDVLREFVNDVEAAHCTAGEDELDRDALQQDWPDLLVTYDHAVAVLKVGQKPDEKTEGR